MKRTLIALVILLASCTSAPRVVGPAQDAIGHGELGGRERPSAAEVDDHTLLLLIAAKVFSTDEMEFVCASLVGEGSRAFLKCDQFGRVPGRDQ